MQLYPVHLAPVLPCFDSVLLFFFLLFVYFLSSSLFPPLLFSSFFLSFFSFFFATPLSFLSLFYLIALSFSLFPSIPPSFPAGTSIIQVTATDADDPTYGNSAKLVYTLVQGQQYFSVDPQTGECVYISECVCSRHNTHGRRNVKDAQMSES